MLLQEGHTDGYVVALFVFITVLIFVLMGGCYREALKLLELGSYCCNRMLLSHMPMIDQLLVRKGMPSPFSLPIF